jgi:hypothetical protein
MASKAQRQPTQRILERTSDDDRAWFQDHPGAHARIRPFVIGEDAGHLPVECKPSHTVVTQFAPGIRSRRFIENRGQGASLGFLYDLKTGEVYDVLEYVAGGRR